MTHITVKEAPEKWNISDRRIRMLCSDGTLVIDALECYVVKEGL